MSVSSTAEPIQCDRGQRRGEIVQSLLTEVFQRRLRTGQRLDTDQLARRFGVSHTPIREALIELAGIGIIDLQPNRGAVVRKVAVKDVREICQVRRALECEAVKLACGRIEVGELESIHKELMRLTAVKSPQRARFVEKARVVDGRLHDLIAAASDNAFLSNELGRLKILFRACRDVAWEHHVARNDYHRLAEEAKEHLAIVQALLDGNRREAASAMSRHIMTGGKYWCRAIDSVNNTNGNGAPKQKTA